MVAKPESYSIELDKEQIIDLKSRVQNKILTELDPTMDIRNRAEVRPAIEELFASILMDIDVVLSRSQRQNLFESIIADIFGFGPLESLLSDATVYEILAVGSNKVYVDLGAGYTLSDTQFEDNEHLLRIIDRIVAPIGKRCSESIPISSGYLQDGSHYTAILAPLSLSGTILHIRKFSKRIQATSDELIQRNIISEEALHFLTESIQSGLNILITGQQNSGKSTLLDLLANQLPDENLAVIIDPKITIHSKHKKTVFLTDRENNIDGRGEIRSAELIRTSESLNPDTLIVDDIGGEELLVLSEYFLPWMGCITIRNYQTLGHELIMRCQLQRPDLPTDLVQKLIAHNVDIVVHLDKSSDMSRVTHIAKISEAYELSDLFRLNRQNNHLERATDG